MKKIILSAASALLIMTLAACSSHDQEKAKDDAHRAASEIKADAKELGQKVDAAVKPDGEKASDKLSEGAARVEDASSKAGVKLDQAALLAKVKTKLASDAGLSTLTKVNVSVDGSMVTLSGTVSNEDQKKAAEQAAAQVEGVTRVNNSLVVEP